MLKNYAQQNTINVLLGETIRSIVPMRKWLLLFTISNIVVFKQAQINRPDQPKSVRRLKT